MTHPPPPPPSHSPPAAPLSDCLLSLPPHAKLVKTALEGCGLLDKSRRVAPSASRPGHLALPLLPGGLAQIECVLERGATRPEGTLGRFWDGECRAVVHKLIADLGP
jgi:hypothetical protein